MTPYNAKQSQSSMQSYTNPKCFFVKINGLTSKIKRIIRNKYGDTVGDTLIPTLGSAQGELRVQGQLKLHGKLKITLASTRPWTHIKQKQSVDWIRNRLKSMVSRRVQHRSRDEQIVECSGKHRNTDLILQALVFRRAQPFNR